MNRPLTIPELATYWLIAVNFAAFCAFAIDKARAERGNWRIREGTLLRLAFFGGTPGAYAGRAIFRHKTRKASFSHALHGVAKFQIFVLICVGGWLLAPPAFKADAKMWTSEMLRSVRGSHTLFRSAAEIREIELSVTFQGCSEARALGRAPVYAGEPGYRSAMDGDGDGVACEPVW